jgi:hypothetical protein
MEGFVNEAGAYTQSGAKPDLGWISLSGSV